MIRCSGFQTWEEVQGSAEVSAATAAEGEAEGPGIPALLLPAASVGPFLSVLYTVFSESSFLGLHK